MEGANPLAPSESAISQDSIRKKNSEITISTQSQNGENMACKKLNPEYKKERGYHALTDSLHG